jgi:hypothetical protein
MGAVSRSILNLNAASKVAKTRVVRHEDAAPVQAAHMMAVVIFEVEPLPRQAGRYFDFAATLWPELEKIEEIVTDHEAIVKTVVIGNAMERRILPD